MNENGKLTYHKFTIRERLYFRIKALKEWWKGLGDGS